MERRLFDATEQSGVARAAWIRALEMTAPIRHDDAPVFPVLIGELADQFGEATALVGEDTRWSYRALAQRMNRYARWGIDQGIGRGSVVSLVMPNSADYLALWLGLTRIGAAVALVNGNLIGESLARAIGMVAPAHIIIDAGLAAGNAAALAQLPGHIRCYATGGPCNAFPNIDDEVARADGAAITIPAPSLGDCALYLYTSGTTGFPKAASISHRRLMEWSHWFSGMMGIDRADCIYNCLPMYHGIGGIVAIGAALVGGGSVAMRPRFSARAFWDDVARWNCTVFQYIGELCRYLVDGPVHPLETAHRIRLACGNGLRREIWERLQARFGIPRVLEFYATTEGALSLYNVEGKVGAIGRIPPFLGHRAPVALIRLDPDTEEPLRGSDGRCVRCAVEQAGEALARIVEDGTGGAGRFDGYTDDAATSAKLLRDVFAVGDCWYRTGDLMRRDKQGFYYFVDRVGDSYRWKGETVSASEVTAAITACPGILDAVVYGVRVPAFEGRAGMAAIVPAPGFDPAELRRALERELPEYAMPLFLRLVSSIETTATFRPRKLDLLRDGFDPEASGDPVYLNDRARKAFVRFDRELYERVLAGAVRL
jgi:fatty-acyl-CoA synthase